MPRFGRNEGLDGGAPTELIQHESYVHLRRTDYRPHRRKSPGRWFAPNHRARTYGARKAASAAA